MRAPANPSQSFRATSERRPDNAFLLEGAPRCRAQSCRETYFTTKPFSLRLLSFGSGGTLATHAFMRVPPTVTVQLPHSPFLQLYFGFSPPFSHALPKLVPAGTSYFLPLITSTVLVMRARGASADRLAAVGTMNACACKQRHASAQTSAQNERMASLMTLDFSRPALGSSDRNGGLNALASTGAPGGRVMSA